MIVDEINLDNASSIVSLLVGITILFGILIRYGLVPYIRSQIVVPVRQISEQVTVNGGRSDPPTLKDEISKIADKQSSVIASVEDNKVIAREALTIAKDAKDLVAETKDAITTTHSEMKAISRMYEGHIEWSDEEVRDIRNQISRQQDEVDRIWKALKEKGSKDV